MYTILFGESIPNTVQTSSTVLECKSFAKTLYQSPGDRHAYSLKFLNTPIRYNRQHFSDYRTPPPPPSYTLLTNIIFSIGRLPRYVKDFYKFIRYSTLPPPPLLPPPFIIRNYFKIFLTHLCSAV